MPLIGGIFSGLRISASGLRAQRIRQNVISSNLANIETTRTAKGGPYRRQYVVFESGTDTKETRLINKKEGLKGTSNLINHLPVPANNFPRDERFFGNGVQVAEIREDSREAKLVYDPSHPDSDEKGYVAMPNVNVVEEMTDMIAASRAYEANVTAFNSMKAMLQQASQL
ncbi:MAG: flagellar basal body rod protein FlgC [Chitinivibrionales bacterium]|nr:flagellar basal body rod protein FlgC [Chitinivibrionales bacterium]